jgi:uncharacterized membrane protein HdeD (DUF308 family)
MKKNVHTIEQVIRIILGIVLLLLVFVGPKTLWGLLGIILLATGLIRFCPLYRLFGISTCKITPEPDDTEQQN